MFTWVALVPAAPAVRFRKVLSKFVSWLNGLSVYTLKIGRNYDVLAFEADVRVVMKRALKAVRAGSRIAVARVEPESSRATYNNAIMKTFSSALRKAVNTECGMIRTVPGPVKVYIAILVR